MYTTGWCVCVCTIRTVVLWYVSPTWTTHYYRRYFVLYNCIVKVTSWLSAGMICHKFKYQLIEHTKYTFHEICGLLVSVTYTEFETSSVVSCRESQHSRVSKATSYGTRVNLKKKTLGSTFFKSVKNAVTMVLE